MQVLSLEPAPEHHVTETGTPHPHLAKGPHSPQDQLKSFLIHISKTNLPLKHSRLQEGSVKVSMSHLPGSQNSVFYSVSAQSEPLGREGLRNATKMLTDWEKLFSNKIQLYLGNKDMQLGKESCRDVLCVVGWFSVYTMMFHLVLVLKVFLKGRYILT